jgi:preprotein translocase subunit SecY
LGVIQSVGVTIFKTNTIRLELYFSLRNSWLTTGAMIVLWLSELITDYGLGNGASLLIYTNIISNT